MYSFKKNTNALRYEGAILLITGCKKLPEKTSLYLENLQNRKDLWANEILNGVVPDLLLEITHF